jgi:RNA polymerase sigma-70 factor (ECF subfamily)
LLSEFEAVSDALSAQEQSLAEANAGRPSSRSEQAATWLRAIAERQDVPSFIALFTSFAPKVKGHLVRRGARESLAEDLAQETFLTIWRKAGQFDPQRASAAAWIYTIARNRRVDALRREAGPKTGWIDEGPPEPVSPEYMLNASQAETSVRCAIAQLSAEQAAVMRLSFFDELTHADIASHLGIPL